MAVLLVPVFGAVVFTMLRAWLFTVAGERVYDLRIRLCCDSPSRYGLFDTGRTGNDQSTGFDTTVLQNTVTVNLSMGLRYLIGALGGWPYC